MDKKILLGTHRTTHPEATWERVRPNLPKMGITRVADLTGLDEIGVPVFQAVRPNSRTLSVSQGKGVTPELAKVSAVMECIELWHAEEVLVDLFEKSVEDMNKEIPYSIFDLPRPGRSTLSIKSRIPWVSARSVNTDCTTWLPWECVQLGILPGYPGKTAPPLLCRTSNGLASGNTLEEAILHAMYEVIERDALFRGNRSSRELVRELDMDSAYGTSLWVLNRFREASVEVWVRDYSEVAGIPCFSAEIWSRSLPLRFGGSGCHRDPDVALSRALTEAAQSRLTLIAGTRDDLQNHMYEYLATRTRLVSPFPMRGDGKLSVVNPEEGSTSFNEDIQFVSSLMEQRVAGGEVYWVNLTCPGIDIPVVRVVAPGMSLENSH